MKKSTSPFTYIPVALIALLGLWRLLSMHFEMGAAYTPMGAIALFSGAYFHKQAPKGYLLTLAVLLASDLLLMHVFYPTYREGFLYRGWIVNYAIFIGIVYLGQQLLRKPRWYAIVGVSGLAALLYWLISNFLVWGSGGFNVLTNTPYTRDLNGLWMCYVTAIPFFKYMLIGNIAYSTLLFGATKLSQYYSIRFKTLVEGRKP